MNKEDERLETIFINIKTSNIRKISSLVAKQKNTKHSDKHLNWTENLSNTSLPPIVAETLSLGPNYALPIETKEEIPVTDLLANIESAITFLPSQAKTTSGHAAAIYKHTQKQNWPTPPTHRRHYTTKKCL